MFKGYVSGAVEDDNHATFFAPVLLVVAPVEGIVRIRPFACDDRHSLARLQDEPGWNVDGAEPAAIDDTILAPIADLPAGHIDRYVTGVPELDEFLVGVSSLDVHPRDLEDVLSDSTEPARAVADKECPLVIGDDGPLIELIHCDQGLVGYEITNVSL